LAITNLKAQILQIASKNAVAENRINKLEKQLQSLEKNEASLQSYCHWLPISWDDENNVQPVIAVNSNSVPVLPVFVKMSGFDRHKIITARWYSDPFYSHERGYKMRLHVMASGLGANFRDWCVSVFLYIIKCAYDDELPWPIKKAFNIKLLNQISDTEHCI